ncbi:MAG: carbohydrate porin [Bacteroidetes bacterium]|nr:carbohydrate porin [Bacteroidota bacterium]
MKLFQQLNLLVTFLLCLVFTSAAGAPFQDTVRNQFWNYHFQLTVVPQYHPAFKAEYSGENSLEKCDESTVSLSATLFLGMRLWKGAQAYFNPEVSGGKGFSLTRGVAGFPNGEVYRVSDPSVHVYVGRLYLRQIFALSASKHSVKDGFNQIAGPEPDTYLSIIAGKFSLMDFFDNNTFSHDPRTQFFNWALMGNGAWDYPANVRGYDYGLAMEFVKPKWSVRAAFTTMPEEANGQQMQYDITKSFGTSLEFEKKYFLGKQAGTFRAMAYFNLAPMGNYKQSIKLGQLADTVPDITLTRAEGHTKYGFGINFEQNIDRNFGVFMRAGWNDGQNETWVFTEIDRTVNFGLNIDGNLWKRDDDNVAVAFIMNGISSPHCDYLKAGGMGFMIGDGNLSYSPEFITEIYYSFRFFNQLLWICPDYQLIINPAYNRVRGPVNAFGLRVHIEI